ncbi:MAG: NTP transferase domain-containing protein [Marinilabiliales bacterium]|nr:NTP transferase domain-containing protein [Marinilabiliales bacterium]
MRGIWAIVLAAGESRRMGSPKMLLPYNGMTVIGQVIENVLAASETLIRWYYGCGTGMRS